MYQHTELLTTCAECRKRNTSPQPLSFEGTVPGDASCSTLLVGEGAGCPYNYDDAMPSIDEIAGMFPNEWLAFVISPTDDDTSTPLHGKLVAHSKYPNEVFDAVNVVLWNQCVYVFFNGDFEAMIRSWK